MGDFRQHAEEARKHFNLIRHQVEQILGGFLVSTERPEHVSGLLDRDAGIDAILTDRAEGLYGVALRIQKNINYRSFTIRKARETCAITEYEKYLKAVQNGCIVPTITVQAYVDTKNGTVLSGGVALTADIYDYIAKYPAEVETKRTGMHNTGLAEFLTVYFEKFKEKGYWIEVF